MIELTAVISILILVFCLYVSIQISWRRPLYYNMFLVEMHTWSARRMVQVLHLGQEFTSNVSWDRLVSRMRARAPRVEGDVRVAISDPHIVVQSPNTVIDSPTTARSPDANRLTLWDIEMPPREVGQAPNPTRDSQYAAAAAIAILARGDDGNLRSRVFFDQLRREPTRNQERHAVPPIQNVEESQITPLVQVESVHLNSMTNEGSDDSEGSSSSSSADTSTSASSEDGETDMESITGSSSTNISMNEEEPCFHIEHTPLSPEDDADKVLIRLKFLNDTEKETFAVLTDTISKYKEDNFKNNGPDKIVRLIFQGQLLRDDTRTLESYGLKQGSVLHCHISSTPYTRPPGEHDPIQPTSTTRSRRSEGGSEEHHHNHHQHHNQHQERRRTSSNRNRQHQNLASPDGTINWMRLIDTILIAIVPVIAAFGFDILRIRWTRGRRDRVFFNPSVLYIAFHWLYNFIMNDNNDDAENRPIPYHVFWIFSCQVVAISSFYFFFPQVVDRTAITLLILVTLYFVFVIWRARPSDGEQDIEIQQEEQINVM